MPEDIEEILRVEEDSDEASDDASLLNDAFNSNDEIEEFFNIPIQ